SAGCGGAEPEGVEPGGAKSEGAESGDATPRGAALSGGPAGASSRLSSQQLLEWLFRSAHRRSGAPGARGARDTRAGGAAVTAGAGDTEGATATGPGGAPTSGAGAVGTGIGVVLGALELETLQSLEQLALELEELELEALTLEALELPELELQALAPKALELQELELLTMKLEMLEALCCRDRTLFPCFSRFLVSRRLLVFLLPSCVHRLTISQPQLQPASPLPAPSPYTEHSGGLTEQREPASHIVSPFRTAHRAPCSRPPPLSGTHAMALHPSSVPLRVPLLAPPDSSLPKVPNRVSDHARAANPTVSSLLAAAVTHPSFESAAASALVAELLDFAAACRLDYAIALVAESMSASPPSVGDIPTPRSYAEAIMGPYSSQWQAAMDGEMASWKSTGTYVDEVPPSRANIVDGMWIFRVKRPPSSSPAFKAPREWHDTLRTTLAALGFAPSTADPLLFLRTDTSLQPFYVLVYVDDLIFATVDSEALTLVKSELQKRHTCTDLGELRSYLGL
ncbi:unnamed protein product, partial [Closterium sp. NIES-54]